MTNIKFLLFITLALIIPLWDAHCASKIEPSACRKTLKSLVEAESHEFPGISLKKLHSLVEVIAREQGFDTGPDWEVLLQRAVAGIQGAVELNPTLIANNRLFRRTVADEFDYQQLALGLQSGVDPDMALSRVAEYLHTTIPILVGKLLPRRELEDRISELTLYFLDEIRNGKITDRHSLKASMVALVSKLKETTKPKSAYEISKTKELRPKAVKIPKPEAPEPAPPVSDVHQDLFSDPEPNIHSGSDPNPPFEPNLSPKTEPQLETAISSLPGDLSQVVRLSNLDLSSEDIAEVTLIPVEEVKTKIMRGRHLLGKRGGVRNAATNPSRSLLKLQPGWLADEKPEIFAELLATLPERDAELLRLAFQEQMSLAKAGKGIGLLGLNQGRDAFATMISKIRDFFSRKKLDQIFPEVLEAQAEAEVLGPTQTIQNALKADPGRIRSMTFPSMHSLN